MIMYWEVDKCLMTFLVAVGILFGSLSIEKCAINQSLYDASENGNFKKVKELISNGADVNAQMDAYLYLDRTPLMGAACDVIKLPLKNGADIKADDGEGGTAMTFAKMRGHKEIVNLLNNNQLEQLTISKNGNFSNSMW